MLDYPIQSLMTICDADDGFSSKDNKKTDRLARFLPLILYLN